MDGKLRKEILARLIRINDEKFQEFRNRILTEDVFAPVQKDDKSGLIKK